MDARAAFLRALQAAALVVALVAILFPLYWMVAGSLKTEGELFAIPPRWIWVYFLRRRCKTG